MASIKDIQNLDQKIDELRKKGRTDTDIVNVLAQGDQQFGSAIQKARSMGQNDRDLLNKTAVQFSGKMPTVQSVPLATETTQNAQNTTVQPSTTQPSIQQPPKLKFTDLALLKPIQTAKNFFSAEKESLTNRKERVGESFNAYQKGEQGLASTDFQVAGNVVGGVIGDTFMNVAKSLWRTLPEDQREQTKAGAKEGLANFAKQVADAQVRKYEQMKINEPEKARQIDELIGKVKTEVNEIQVNPEKQRNFEAALDLTDLAGLGLGKKAVKDGIKPVLEGIETGIETGLRKLPPPPGPDDFKQFAQSGVQSTKETISTGADKLSSTGFGQKIVEVGERIPRAFDRVTENLDEAKVKAEKIRQSTPAVKDAFKSNLDEIIINTVVDSDIPTVKSYKEMVDIAEKTKTLGVKKRPELIAGESAAQQYKLIDNQRKATGERLGEAVSKLSKTPNVDMSDSIKSLERVLEGEGVVFTKKGMNFSGTGFSPQARVKINELYKLATESRFLSPQQIHRKDRLFSQMGREAKFESLGDVFIKTPDGETSLFNIFRDVFNSKLDSLSPEILELNKEYRKWRILVDDIDGTITKSGKYETNKNMDVAENAQTNLRRMLSDAQSAADYRNISRQMDIIARELGYTGGNPEQLIAFATELRKIFPDIVPQTSATGIVSGVSDLVMKVLDVGAPGLKDQQKALKAILDEKLGKPTTPTIPKKKGRLPQPNEQAYGAIGGIEVQEDEQGKKKLGFNPQKAVLGVGLMSGVGKIKKSPLFEDVKKYNSASEFVKAKNPPIDLSIYEKGNEITLSKIVVPANIRGSGVGTKAMEDLIRYADIKGKRILLSPSKDYGASSISRLTDFYKRFGFVENKGKTRDFSTRESMIRLPKNTENKPTPDLNIKSITPDLSQEAKKYKTTINIQDKNDLNYLRRILSEDNIKDIQSGKMTNFRGSKYSDLAKVNIISEAPQTVEQQLAGKIKDVKLKSNTFYHGTSAENSVGIMKSGFKSGGDLPEDAFRGGGYGKMQNSISFAETPKEASIFSTLSKNGEIVEAKLKDGAKVVSIEGVEDAIDLEDYITYLKKEKIDAVYIGGGEKELVVINPKAVTPVKSQLTDIWNKANKKTKLPPRKN